MIGTEVAFLSEEQNKLKKAKVLFISIHQEIPLAQHCNFDSSQHEIVGPVSWDVVLEVLIEGPKDAKFFSETLFFDFVCFSHLAQNKMKQAFYKARMKELTYLDYDFIGNRARVRLHFRAERMQWLDESGAPPALPWPCQTPDGEPEIPKQQPIEEKKKIVKKGHSLDIGKRRFK